ncbi:pilus assembly protein [Ornithinimicrobium sp. Y1847]
MLAGLVSLVLLAAMQLAFALHLHNTATAHVVEGARHGARADLGPEQGAARARELLSASLPGGDAAAVSATRTSVGGVQIVEVSASLRLPVVGPFGPADAMTVTGQAYAEDQ